jgi:hypothetical protein
MEIILLIMIINATFTVSVIISKLIFTYLINEIHYLVYLSYNNLQTELLYHIIKLYLTIIFLYMDYPLHYHPRHIN